MRDKQFDRALKAGYYNARYPGSFGGVEQLHRLVRIPKTQIKKWLSHQDAYTLHKPVRKRFPRRRIIVTGILEQYQCDLIDVQRLKSRNDGFGYILTCIDVFTKKAYANPIKNKTSTCVVRALRSIFDRGGVPKNLQTDKGTEFLNANVQKFLRQVGVKHFTSENETIKAAVVERFNRTLLSRLYRFFTYSQSERFVEILPDLIESYNNTYHRSIKKRPVDVNVENQEEVWQTLYGREPQIPALPPSLQPGDRVRISETRRNFKKGYLPAWTEELFTVSRPLRTTPYTYVIKDDAGEEVIGSFYPLELQKVGEKEVYQIDSILRQRKGAGERTEVLVKWRGYPDSFNSWIPKRHLKSYNP